jgi:transcriptional regulator with XRE-family HTH domain
MLEGSKTITEGPKTVADTVAGNVRVYRQLRGIDQSILALRMQSLGVAWRQVTVSEVERNQRNVTVSELVGLALALETTIEQLLDTRGPERLRGPLLSLYDNPADTVDRRVHSLGIWPDDVTALVCTHVAYAVPEWDDDHNIGLVNLHFKHEDEL